MEEKPVADIKNFLLTLALVMFPTGEVASEELVIYYDGFWTQHRVYQTEQRLIEQPDVVISFKKASDLNAEIQQILFENFVYKEEMTVPEDIIFLAILKTAEGDLSRKVLGNRHYLYDVGSRRYKALNDNQKDVVRCYFINNGESKASLEIQEHCKKNHASLVR